MKVGELTRCSRETNRCDPNGKPSVPFLPTLTYRAVSTPITRDCNWTLLVLEQVLYWVFRLYRNIRNT